MSKLGKFLFGLMLVQITVAVNVVLPAQTRTAPASAQQSAPICQYPDRWTNPPGGCDNSDPAVPECIKAFSTEQGEKDCIAAFVVQHEQPQPFETIVPTQFGGK